MLDLIEFSKRSASRPLTRTAAWMLVGLLDGLASQIVLDIEQIKGQFSASGSLVVFAVVSWWMLLKRRKCDHVNFLLWHIGAVRAQTAFLG